MAGACEPRCTISRVKLRAFKNVTAAKEFEFAGGLNCVVGPNGCGKSSLLDAVCFALGAPARALGVDHLRSLHNTECAEVRAGGVATWHRVRRAPDATPGLPQVCEVTGELESRQGRGKGSAARHRITAALTPDGGRAFKLNGKAATGKQVKASQGAVHSPRR